MNMRSVIFSALPVHDTCWSITTGKDGKIYVGVCGEMTGGLGVFLVSYDPEEDEVKYVLDVAEALHEPPDNGHATHSKIHYCLVPSSDGTLYGATHCTGAPIGELIWRPWNCWDDPIRMFTGFHIFNFDPKTEEIEDFGVMTPNEGSRCMVLAEKRRKLYGVTYPRDHFYVYDLETNEYRDLGRIGDVNPQSIFIDKEENGYTVDDFGFIVKYDADADELVHLDAQLPYAEYRDGTHNLIYDSVPSPDGEAVYGVHWNVDVRRLDNRLFRYDFYDGPQGKIHDLGWAYRPSGAGPAWSDTRRTNNHTGGLVFGEDGYLYYATYFHWEEPNGMYLIRMNVETLEREVICPIEADGLHAWYIAKATTDYAGNLYFASCVSRPTRIFVYSPPYVKKGAVTHRKWPLVRPWG